MEKIIPLLAWGISVFISHKYAARYWVVGPVFAAALLAAHFDQIRKKISLRHFGLVIASTLIYALVFWISDKGWKFRQDWLDMLAGSLTAGVLLGSLLLPAAHALLFGIDLKTVRSVFLWLIASWYLVILISLASEALGFRTGVVDYFLFAIAAWQGIYMKRLKLT